MGVPPALDIDLLRTFVLIAEGASFSAAAQRIGRTQSAVSLQVQRLESLVGRQLFDRSRGGAVRLTLYGERLLEHARSITTMNDGALLALRSGEDPAPQDADAIEPPTLERAAKPVVEVRGFRNLSDSPEQDYFVDGLTADLVAGLSRLSWLLVVPPRGAETAADGLTPLRRNGSDLRPRYSLRGSVRRASNRLRVTAELLEAATNTLLWSERYDGQTDDAFDFQDRITDQVVAAVEPRMRRREIDRSRRKRSGNLDAYDLYLRALPHTAAHMPGGTEIAIPLLESALRVDPDYAPAHALIAWCYEWRYTRGGFDEANRSRSLYHADAALGPESDDAIALSIAGFVTSLVGREREVGLRAMKRAISLSPSSTLALYLASHAHAIAGEVELARSLADRALLLSPHDPLAFEANLALGDIAMLEERFDDAAACFGRSAVINPRYSTARFFRGMAMALAGEPAAGPTIRQGLQIEPAFTSRIVVEVGMAADMAQRFFDGARMVGLPT